SYSELKKVPIMGDICDRKRVREVFAIYKPDIIIHAAAHKHVPLMEINSMESIKNNVLGTKTIAEEAINFKIERFIMLSTDKAVSPTSLMGVSKRVTERYISAVARKNGTRFMAVRFGNVLGSEGSVVPTFKKQIAAGGPLTVTHPEIKRYFMTIPEAAGLVLEAGFMGKGGEIFVLEMGNQIKIVDIAKDLTRLSGKEPYKDIEIVFTGLRPGEKMHEALIELDEEIIKTDNEKIMILKPNRYGQENTIGEINELAAIVNEGNSDRLIEKLHKIVPTYTPSEHVLKKELTVTDNMQKIKNEVDILIVDDEEPIRKVLGKFVEGRGYNALLAANGKDALNIVKTNNVSIAILDIRMPGLINGLKVLKNIRKLNKNIHVMIITGFGTDKAKDTCVDYGAAYFEKPFELAEINDYIEQALLPRFENIA
ncbi:polysaccharide biosynthesis protein, partial [Elusimicrobiota bacterium]